MRQRFAWETLLPQTFYSRTKKSSSSRNTGSYPLRLLQCSMRTWRTTRWRRAVLHTVQRTVSLEDSADASLTSREYYRTILLIAAPRKYGHSSSARTPFQKLNCRKPMVKSHSANQAPPIALCCSMRIFSMRAVYTLPCRIEEKFPLIIF